MKKAIKLGDPIDETGLYYLCVADLPGVDLPCYAVVSKVYGVVEMSTSVLANAKKFLEMLTEWAETPPGSKEELEELPDFPIDPSQLS